MERIELTPEQSRVYADSDNDFIEVCATDGAVVGRILSAKMKATVTECKRRSQTPGPRYSTDQVQHLLRTLVQRWADEGPFGPERTQEIVDEVRRMRAEQGSSPSIGRNKRKTISSRGG